MGGGAPQRPCDSGARPGPGLAVPRVRPRRWPRPQRAGADAGSLLPKDLLWPRLQLLGCRQHLPNAQGMARRAGRDTQRPLSSSGRRGRPPCVPPAHTCRRALTWMPFSCRFRYRVLTGMLAGTSARSLRVQITRLAWLLQEQAAGHEVAGGEPPPAAKVKATPPPPAPRGGENSQRKSRAPWGQDILPGGRWGHGEPRARAILNVHAPCGRRGAVGDRE